ncbi:MAG: AAA family ATPase [Chloroflexales bacterium]|nr:AAA family ATPase [Chloroflexales bacterium]
MDIPTTPPDVSREAVIAELTAAFQAVQRPGPAPRIINIWGIAGIGKSYLLRQTFRRLSEHACVYWLRLSAKSALLEVPGARELRSWQPILAALRAIPGLEQSELPNVALANDRSVSLIHNGRPPIGPVVLLIDDTGDFDHWRWLQKDVIKPVVNLPQSLVVVTSHIELFWDLSDLRSTCEPRELPRFQRDEIELYLKNAQLESLEPLTQTIYDYTSGYPLAVDFFVKQLQRQRQTPGRPSDLSHFTERTQAQLMRYLGVVRLPEIDVLLKVPEAAGDFAERAALLSARAELENRKPALLTKVLQGLPARIDQQLRATVRRAIEAAEPEPDGYLARCRSLEAIYYERAEARPKTWAHAFLEWLFFSLELLRAGDEACRASWPTRFHTLFGRLLDSKDEDTSLASSTLYALFCRDAELIDSLKTFEQSYVEALRSADPRPPRPAQSNQTLYDYVHLKFSTLLADAEQVNRVFINEFDASCTKIIDALYDRLGAADCLPSKLRHKDSFRVSIRNILDPGNQSAVRLDTLRQRVSMGISGTTSLLPSEIDQVVTFFGSRGFLSYSRDGTFSFNPLIHGLVSLAKLGTQQKEPLSASLNSSQ